jgi:hypothetical protein
MIFSYFFILLLYLVFATLPILHLVHAFATKDAHRNNIHTAVAIELDRLCKFAGLWSTREPRDAFREDLPENQCGPDISIRNADALDSASNVIHIDATITSRKRNKKGTVPKRHTKRKSTSIKAYGKRAAEITLKMLWLFGLKLFLLF